MTAWLLGLWGRLPARLRTVLAAIGAALAAACALFFLGRRSGRQEERIEHRLEGARQDAGRIRDLAASGKDDEVQRELARQTAAAKKRTRGLKGLLLLTALAMHASALGAEPDVAALRRASGSSAAAADTLTGLTYCAAPPAWCRPGYHCVPEDCRAAAEASTCEERPWWAPDGWSAMPTACAAEAAAQLGILTAELDAARARRWRRFHFDLTCGAGFASALISRSDPAGGYTGADLDWFPTPGGCLAGVAFRLGR
jgi:hypothetical protein